jgi:hypothetical protein
MIPIVTRSSTRVRPLGVLDFAAILVVDAPPARLMEHIERLAY